MIKQALTTLLEGKDISRENMIEIMNYIMEGKATDSQIGAFLMGLRMKGETIDEITGAAQVMREKAVKITPPGPCIDTCGTGGDSSGTFNISTTAAFVVSGAGITVAKHGNRAASSKSGSADVLQELGVNIEAPPDLVEKCLQDVGIGFLFAPVMHQAMRHAIGPRKEMAVRTVFNVLGPLTNPAGAERQLLGVFGPDLTEVMAGVLKNLGSQAAMVVHGLDGLDEMTLTGKTKVSELKDGEVKTYEVSPEDFGLSICAKEDLAGGTPSQNAKILKNVLSNEKGPALDAVCLNAGAAIYVSGKASSIIEGIEKAFLAVESGEAMNKLKKLVEISKG